MIIGLNICLKLITVIDINSHFIDVGAYIDIEKVNCNSYASRVCMFVCVLLSVFVSVCAFVYVCACICKSACKSVS